jgi:regulator of cell morphogenesis and NO signaling
MAQVNLNSSVGNWVAAHPQTSRIFEAMQIDYCCGGGKSLEQACWDRGLDPQQVLQQLEQSVTEDEQSSRNWLNAPLTELCDHIEKSHHAYLKEELPRLTEMVAKVVRAHGETTTPVMRYLDSKLSLGIIKFPRTPVTPIARCWPDSVIWNATCIGTSTKKTASCFPGR